MIVVLIKLFNKTDYNPKSYINESIGLIPASHLWCVSYVQYN